MKLGHRNIPVDSVGCYVPGGRYPMVASAHMSVVTARMAGVRSVLAATPPNQAEPHAETIAPMVLGEADEIYVIGGVQALLVGGLVAVLGFALPLRMQIRSLQQAQQLDDALIDQSARVGASPTVRLIVRESTIPGPLNPGRSKHPVSIDNIQQCPLSPSTQV